MTLLLTDDEIALFAKMPRSRLEAIVALVARTPDDFEADTLALLEMAEKLGLPGHIDQRLHHDGRGRVNGVKHAPEWNRQAKGRKSA